MPFGLRARLAYDGELLGGVSRELAAAVQDFYRPRFEQLGVRGGKTGSVTVVQRSNSDLRLNPHYHQMSDTPDTLDYERLAQVVTGVYAAMTTF